MSPPAINVDELLAPLAGRSKREQAGVPLDVVLEQRLKETRESALQEGEAGSTQWREIIKESVQQLTRRSKDFRLVSFLIEALVKECGIGGLRVGLELVRRLAEKCWERMYFLDRELNEEQKKLEVDLDARRDLLEECLNNHETGVQFPHIVLSAPLMKLQETSYSAYDLKHPRQGQKPPVSEILQRASLNTPQLGTDLRQVQVELKKLGEVLAQKFAGEPPSLNQLEAAVEACAYYVALLGAGKPPSAPGGDDAPPPSTGPEGRDRRRDADPPNADGLSPRDKAYRELDRIADLLEELEPHSPVPDLLRHAVKLGKLSFRELLREIVRDKSLIQQVYEPPP